MLNRRTALALAFIFPLWIASAGAAEFAFTDAALEEAKKAGQPIVVDVAASWCPVCKTQKSILEDLAKTDKFKGFVILRLDFDSQKDELRKLNARSHSTLIVFKGANEVARSIGDTDPAAVEALLAKAL